MLKMCQIPHHAGRLRPLSPLLDLATAFTSVPVPVAYISLHSRHPLLLMLSLQP